MTFPRWSPAPEAEYPDEWAWYRLLCAEGAALAVEPSRQPCSGCGQPMTITPEIVPGYSPRIVGGTVMFQGDTRLGRLECLNINCPAGPGWHQRKREHAAR